MAWNTVNHPVFLAMVSFGSSYFYTTGAFVAKRKLMAMSAVGADAWATYKDMKEYSEYQRLYKDHRKTVESGEEVEGIEDGQMSIAEIIELAEEDAIQTRYNKLMSKSSSSDGGIRTLEEIKDRPKTFKESLYSKLVKKNQANFGPMTRGRRRAELLLEGWEKNKEVRLWNKDESTMGAFKRFGLNIFNETKSVVGGVGRFALNMLWSQTEQCNQHKESGGKYIMASQEGRKSVWKGAKERYPDSTWKRAGYTVGKCGAHMAMAAAKGGAGVFAFVGAAGWAGLSGLWTLFQTVAWTDAKAYTLEAGYFVLDRWRSGRASVATAQEREKQGFWQGFRGHMRRFSDGRSSTPPVVSPMILAPILAATTLIKSSWYDATLGLTGTARGPLETVRFVGRGFQGDKS